MNAVNGWVECEIIEHKEKLYKVKKNEHLIK